MLGTHPLFQNSVTTTLAAGNQDDLFALAYIPGAENGGVQIVLLGEHKRHNSLRQSGLPRCTHGISSILAGMDQCVLKNLSLD